MKCILPLVFSCLIGCQKNGSTDPQSPSATVAAEKKSNLAYLATSTASDPDLSTLSSSSNAFAFSLFSTLSQKESGNFVLSPYSLRSAFALLYPGSSGAGESEITKALGFALPQAMFHENMKGLKLHYESLQTSEDKQTIEFKASNNVWVQNGRELQPSYLDTIKSYYDAGVNVLDFQTKPKEAINAINTEVEAATKGLIKDLLREGDINSETTLLLTNSVYLLADWLKPFDPNLTEANRDFTTGNGVVSKVMMVNQTTVFPYFEDAKLQAVAIPYAKKNLAMVLILPKSGQTLGAWEAALDGNQWNEVLTGMVNVQVQLALPRFSFTWGSKSLKDELKTLGLNAVFTPSSANFANLLKINNSVEMTWIQDVVHQVRIIVDEKGTEAAAATSVSVGTTSAAVDPPKVFRVNRPAFFAIYDNKFKSILFLGHLSNPQ